MIRSYLCGLMWHVGGDMGKKQYKPCSRCGENMGKYAKGDVCRDCLEHSPTPEEIAAGVKRIQAEWDERKERIRRGVEDERWEPPMVRSYGTEPTSE